MTDELLAVDSLRTHIQTGDGIVRAVDGVSFTVNRGETVCLVGESGSGKTLTCDTITGLVDPPADVSGSVRFDGEALLSMDERTLRTIRGNRIAYVFQHAQNALDPVYTVGDQLIEAMTFHEDIGTEAATRRAISLLRSVGLSQPHARIDQYPHELSDGMAQRVAMAIGLAAEPELLIADEPTSALDVLIQARLLDVLDELRDNRDLAMLLVTHDLRVAATLADRVVVLYGGTAVEQGPADAVFDRPSHPYTQELIRSFTGDDDWRAATAEVPDHGCPFYRECPLVADECRDGRPPLHAVADSEDHRSACLYHDGDHDSSLVFDRIPSMDRDVMTVDAVNPAESGGESRE